MSNALTNPNLERVLGPPRCARCGNRLEDGYCYFCQTTDVAEATAAVAPPVMEPTRPPLEPPPNLDRLHASRADYGAATPASPSTPQPVERPHAKQGTAERPWPLATFYCHRTIPHALKHMCNMLRRWVVAKGSPQHQNQTKSTFYGHPKGGS